MTTDPMLGLYDRPVLIVDPGMHTAKICRADIDRDGRFAVTGSLDKTVRVWSLQNGALERTIRLPAGPGHVGEVRAVAISPDGDTIAAGGWIGPTGGAKCILLFDRATGATTGRIDGLPDTIVHLAFSPHGNRLAATLSAGYGLRVYDGARQWKEIARDDQYGGDSCGAIFLPDGRLVTSSLDCTLRL
jgi:WD40 repeat protein